MTALRLLAATLHAYRKVRNASIHAKRVIDELVMLQRLFAAVVQARANAHDQFSFPAVSELIKKELPRCTQEMESLKKKLDYPCGHTARIRASFVWMYRQRHVELTLQHFRHFQTMLTTALIADNM